MSDDFRIYEHAASYEDIFFITNLLIDFGACDFLRYELVPDPGLHFWPIVLIILDYTWKLMN